MFVNHVCQNLFSCSLTRLFFIRLQKKESSLQSNDTTIEKLVDKSNKKTKIPKFNIFTSNDTTLRSLSKRPSTIIKPYGKTTNDDTTLQSLSKSLSTIVKTYGKITTQLITRPTQPMASYIFIKCYHLFSII